MLFLIQYCSFDFLESQQSFIQFQELFILLFVNLNSELCNLLLK